MGKKTKSKARLDKYYHLSKEMGYRSRAAFKLIQLNKKYNFLSGATVLIDLCAAPGGWCQVAAKEMPISSIKIGIDLDPIKPIPGVTTFQCDITTEQCRHLIRKEIKHLKADVVLHDGAPNVGGQWAKDSYNQNELVLYSIKLACEFLKEGGWFISKVFRSVDYNALLYVMKQLFNKVEATKPLASRTQAAEIFVICQGYKNPSYIDPKLLDPKYALKQIDDEDTMKNNTINSIKAMFDRKKNRSGYNTDTLFIVKSFKDFIECSNPFKFLFETNKIKIQTDDCKKYLEVLNKKPKEYELYFDDLQVLGKKEMEELIIWRNKIRTKLNLSRKENMKEKEEEKKDKKEKDINEEMDEEIKKYEKQRKKRLEAQKRKQEKIELSNKKAFILQEDQPHDNDVENDDELYEYMQKHNIDIENLEEPKNEEEEEEEEKEEEINYSDLSEEDYIDMMNEDIEENKRLYEEEKEIKKRNKEKGEKKKKKGEIELVKNENKENDDISDDNIDNEEDEEENEGDDSALYDEEDENEDEEEEFEEEEKENKKGIPLNEDDDNDNLESDVIINNPLRKEKKKNKENTENKKEDKNKINNNKKEDESENEDNLSYDTDEQEEKNNLLNKKTKREKEESSSSDSDDDGYNSDEKAEIRAIAKKMLRKKERLKILNSSYNRYAFEDDEKVPKWFLEDESKHNKPQKPVTKAEILAEKEYLRKITVRMPKKVLEAKARKRNRLNKRLQKIKKQAEGIANQDEYTEISKVKQIEKLYKREINKSKEKKKYIISRSWLNNKGKDSRNVRHVDRRMKKDKRAIKARDKRNKKYKRRR